MPPGPATRTPKRNFITSLATTSNGSAASARGMTGANEAANAFYSKWDSVHPVNTGNDGVEIDCESQVVRGSDPVCYWVWPTISFRNANHSYRRELADVGPNGGDGGADNVRREFEFQSQQEPNSETQPDVSPLASF